MVASRAKRLATFITGLVECMGFAGVVFGWASLVFVLKEDKYYADLCVTPPNSTKSDCSAQDERFSLIFTVASFLNNFMTLPNGFIFDRFGTLVTRLLGIVTCRKPGVYSLNAVSPDGLRRRRAKDANGTENDKPLTDTAPSSEPPVATFRSCVLSCLFAWHLVWMSVMQLRHYLFIGTLNPMLTHLSHGDQNLISSYTNAFAFTQLCAVFCAPWNGLIMDRHKRGKKEDSGTPASNMLDDLRSSILSLAITCVQCVVFSIFAAIPILSVQYATFIFQVVNRSFLFGGNAAFLAMAFPLQHFGKLYGLVMALSAIVSLLQYPCFALMKNVLGGDPFYVNIGMLIFILLAFIHPINVFFECRKREQALPKAPAMLADEGRGQADSNI